jgi:hypothetical protein
MASDTPNTGNEHPLLPLQFRPPNVVHLRAASPFSAGLQKSLDEARQSGHYYIIVCRADDHTADCEIKIHSERSGSFHRGNLVRAWQRAGQQILDFDPFAFESVVNKLMPKIVEMVVSEINKGAGGNDNGNSATAADTPIAD